MVSIDRKTYDEAVSIEHSYIAKPGVSEELVRFISKDKQEPEWMLQKRLQGLELFNTTKTPEWGPDLKDLNFDKIVYYVKPEMKETKTWEELPEEIRRTAEKIGIPEAEKNALGGAGFQFDSSMAYHHLKKELENQGVIFENMDVAVKKYPELVKKYFMTSCIPVNDHKFIMLHAAVWSGGTFIYVPKNVKVKIPLQAYFRMNALMGGQFEHTLIIADEGSEIQYIEGCSSPLYSEGSLHAGCVEIHVLEGAKVRYSSVENWSKNVFNLNTKRAVVQKKGVIEWINGNMGCLTESARIFTDLKGLVSIRSIKSGDKVCVWDEKTNTIKKSLVKSKIFSGHKDVYLLEAGGRSLEASANHPFLTLVRRKNHPSHKKGFFHFEWKPLEQLKPGDLVGLAKQLPLEGKNYTLPRITVGTTVQSNNQHSSFMMDTSHLYNQDIVVPEKTTDDFMWLAGILIGDGFVDVKQNKINIATHEREDYRDYLCGLLEKLFNYSVTEKKERYIIINSKILCTLFAELNLAGGAHSKKIPSWIFTLPKSQILSFLAGYFDSDGHVCNSALAFTSINKPLLEDVKSLGISLGFGVSRIMKHGNARTVTILGNECSAKDSWRLLFNGKNVYDMPSRCAKKNQEIKKRVRTRRNYRSCSGKNFGSKINNDIGFARIDKITSLGVEPTYDIEVEHFHNFIANGLIVHNSHTTMLYPCSLLVGEGASSDSLGIAFAGEGQHQDTGTKVVHAASHTSSTIRAKSISKAGGVSSYRGLVSATKNAHHTTSSVVCDALLIDGKSVSCTYPTMKVDTSSIDVAHEARVGKIGEKEIFYLMSRGLSEEQAVQTVVRGFIEPVVKALPLEYAVELNKLIELEMEGVVG